MPSSSDSSWNERGVRSIMGCWGYNRVFGVPMGCFGVNRCVGGEKGCRGYNGVQMGCFEVFKGKRGVWGEKGCFVAKRGV